MKNCSEIMELMSLYIDNELDDLSRKELEKHIKSCESCRKDLDELKEIVGILSSNEEVELPAGFKENLHGKLMEEKKNQKSKSKLVLFRRKYLSIASSIAAGLILMFIVRTYMFTGGGNMSYDMKPEQDAAHYSIKDDGTKSIMNKEKISESLTIAGANEKAEGTLSYDEEQVKSGKESPSDDPKAYVMSPENRSAMDETKYTVAFNEQITDNNVYITIKSSDAKESIENIASIAKLYSIVVYDANITVTTSDTAVATSSPQEKDLKKNRTLSFKVENSKYDDFISKLKENYKDGIIIDDKSPASDKIKTDLEKRLSEIDDSIKSESSSQELENLEGERVWITEELGRINDEENYKTCIITIE